MSIFQAQYLPVVQRELREGARRPVIYWLRVAGAAAAVAVLWFAREDVTSPVVGGLRIFTELHTLLLGLICVTVPAMGADCIAWEKREGTLGLLFLTPLDAFGVVVGKAMVQAIRALTLWLTIAPVMVIPFVCGGVTWGDAGSAIVIEFCVTLLCLTAGIIASSLVKTRARAFLLAVCLGGVAVVLFSCGLGLFFEWQVLAPTERVTWTRMATVGQRLVTGGDENYSSAVALSGRTPRFGGPVGQQVRLVSMGKQGPVQAFTYMITPPGRPNPNSTSYVVVRATSLSAVAPMGWGNLFSAPGTKYVWQPLLEECLLLVPLICLASLGLAARKVAKIWRDSVPSPRRDALVKIFCLPRKHERFAWKSREVMEANPVEWLQQYSWQARLSKWTMCLGFVGVEGVFSMVGPDALVAAQAFMFWALAFVFTFVGVNGFLTEKKSGALELLLVTPVTPDTIIWGRVLGLWKQFLPAGVTLLLLWMTACVVGETAAGANAFLGISRTLWKMLAWPISHRFFRGGEFLDMGADPTIRIFTIGVGFFALPVFATCFALRVKNLIAAAAWTWAALLACPVIAFTGVGLMASANNDGIDVLFATYVAVLAVNWIAVILMCRYLRRSLSQRIYSF